MRRPLPLPLRANLSGQWYRVRLVALLGQPGRLALAWQGFGHCVSLLTGTRAARG